MSSFVSRPRFSSSLDQTKRSVVDLTDEYLELRDALDEEMGSDGEDMDRDRKQTEMGGNRIVWKFFTPNKRESARPRFGNEVRSAMSDDRPRFSDALPLFRDTRPRFSKDRPRFGNHAREMSDGPSDYQHKLMNARFSGKRSLPLVRAHRPRFNNGGGYERRESKEYKVVAVIEN